MLIRRGGAYLICLPLNGALKFKVGHLFEAGQ